ncbi:MAG TPA: hypothetical protein VFM05_15350, partial [Candidatus Saccharimonadales bacterium]|nr:hypothetical protein [Candidatus Saccharimonadales bacterium]
TLGLTDFSATLGTGRKWAGFYHTGPDFNANIWRGLQRKIEFICHSELVSIFSNLVITKLKSSSIMLVLLGLLIFVYTLGAGICLMYGVEPSARVEFIYHVGFLSGVIWWLQADAGRSEVKRVYCPGVLVSSGWLIIIPYHLLKTRGAKGLIPLLILIGSYVIAYILTMLLYLSLVAFNPP